MHHGRAIAEYIWCAHQMNHMRELGKCTPSVTINEVKLFCGEHWSRTCKEWRAVARLCRRQAELESCAGHPVVAAILRAVADKLIRSVNPFKAVSDAIELLKWIPSPAIAAQKKTPMKRQKSVEAWEDVSQLPILDASAKFAVFEQIRTKPGRPSNTRGVAAEGLERHEAGESWPDLERELLPDRQNAKNPGEDLRREVQLLKAVLRQHAVALT